MPVVDDSLDLKNLTREEARAAFVERGEQRFRGDQVFRQVHGRGVETVESMTDLPRALREKLAKTVSVPRLAVATMQVSVDGTRKMTMRTADERLIETVLIPDGDAGTDSDEPDDVSGEEDGSARSGPHPALSQGERVSSQSSEFDGGGRASRSRWAPLS